MKYCTKCLYPETAKPTIYFDKNGVCSGCNYNSSRKDADVNWNERKELFGDLVKKAKEERKQRNNRYDCIIPVSGGKDSHFQVYVCKEIYGLNPLLVTYNHGFNNPAGNLNLKNLVEKSGCDSIRLTVGKDSSRRIAKHMLERVGDLEWHYHAGIMTLPFKVAVEKNIPIIIWGEHGFAELTGIVSLKEFVEFTNWKRLEHDMRGVRPEELIGHNGITEKDIDPYIYPSDEEIINTDVKGIYMSNYFEWDALNQAKTVINTWGFNTISYERDRTFNLYSKLDDHADEIHDYLKYLKFGYGRATDDATTEIRKGRLDRSSGIGLVKKYDTNTPRTLESYINFMQITKPDFYKMIEPLRDPIAWSKNSKNVWELNNPIWEQENYEIDYGNEIFKEENKNLYYNEKNLPDKSDNSLLNNFPLDFEWS